MSKGTDTAGSQAFELASLDTVSDGLRAGVQAVYEEAFPSHQREPFADIVAASRDGGGIALVPVDGGQPIGLAFLGSLDDAGPLFLEYFAVAADRRGAGLGQALWRASRGRSRGARGAGLGRARGRGSRRARDRRGGGRAA